MINLKGIDKILINDGVIAFVTDTVWGLGCLPSSEKAVKRIYEIKKREAQKPLILMSNDIYHLLEYVKPLPKIGRQLMKKHFPGALTIVTEKSEKTPDYITSGKETVGIRVPYNNIFGRICAIAPNHVLATTSANLSHQPSAKTYEQTLQNLSGLVDLVVPDFGYTCKGLESTVVEVVGDDVKILRQGAVNI